MSKFAILAASILLMASFSLQAQDKKVKKEKIKQKKNEMFVKISTSQGDIILKLYPETPIHSQNFLRLASEGKFNGSPFHRVIQGFMVQGGETSPPCDSTLPAEIVHPQYFHKRGALAAARMGDDVNPQRRSSGCQFYIVQGRVFNSADLERMKQRSGVNYTEEQVKAYSTVGGAPHLDGSYTVFGEVVDGMETVDKIAAVEKLPGDKPKDDIKMTVTVLKKYKRKSAKF